MGCPHPPEEHQHVYDGRPLPRPGRFLCGLCGELLYLLPDGLTLNGPPPSPFLEPQVRPRQALVTPPGR